MAEPIDFDAVRELVSPRTAADIAKARLLLMAWAEATGNEGSARHIAETLTARAVALGLEKPDHP